MRERKRGINKGSVLERVGGMTEEQGEEREESTRIHKERETDRERNEREKWESRWETREKGRREVGCKDERAKERVREERQGVKLSGRERAKCQTDK